MQEAVVVRVSSLLFRSHCADHMRRGGFSHVPFHYVSWTFSTPDAPTFLSTSWYISTNLSNLREMAPFYKSSDDPKCQASPL